MSDGERALLGRSPSWPPRRYSTIAGFVEPGESLEDTVLREVLEETGVAVHNVRYHSSQPWPFPSSLMLGFFASAAPGSAVRVGGELEDARWFTRAQVTSGKAHAHTVNFLAPHETAEGRLTMCLLNLPGRCIIATTSWWPTDEFDRPAGKWPRVLAGRDLRANRTWLALDRQRFGVVTNFHAAAAPLLARRADPRLPCAGDPSRTRASGS